MSFPVNGLPTSLRCEMPDKSVLKFVERALKGTLFSYPKKEISRIEPLLPEVLSVLTDSIRIKKRLPENLPLDWKKALSFIQLDAALEATFYYFLQRRIFLSDPAHPLLLYLANLSRIRTGVELYFSTEIGSGLNIQHGSGIVVGGGCEIGKCFTIHQGVTLGQKKVYSGPQKITIGNHVVLYAGAKVLGNITVGDNVHLAANAVLLKDAESHSVYAGVPAQKIKSLEPL